MFAMNRMGVKSLAPYLVLGAVLWVCVLKSGVHATLRGVATGLLIPHVDKRNMIDDEVEHSPLETPRACAAPVGRVRDPADLRLRQCGPGTARIESVASAGRVAVRRGCGSGRRQADRYLRRGVGAAQARMGALSRRAWTGARCWGLGLLCGIGFTMSLFIASLAYLDPILYDEAVLGIFVASVVSALLGVAWLRAVLPAR
jgi:NhaA family Na+:H+ antiporter